MFIQGRTDNEFISLAGIGAELAHMSDTAIATMFNSFITELFKICETQYYGEMQLHAVAEQLTDQAKEQLTCMTTSLKEK